MIEQGTVHIAGSKKPTQVDAGEMLRVLDALDQAGYKVVRKSHTMTPPNVMINNMAADIEAGRTKSSRQPATAMITLARR